MDFDVIIIWCDHVVVISLSLVSHENVVVTVLSCFESLTLGAYSQRGLRYLVRVCVCVCVCVSAPFRPLRVKVSPENDTNASS